MHELLHSMGSRELTEWMAYAQSEPFGEDRADLRAGIIAAAVGNHGARYPKNPYRALDFMPMQKREAEKPVLLDDPEAQSALIMGLLDRAASKPRVH